MKFYGIVLVVALSSALCLQACGKSNSGPTVNIAEVTPIVKAALPAGLRPGAVAPVASIEIGHALERATQRTPITTYTPTANQMPSALPSYNSDQYALAQVYIQNLFQSTYAGDSGSNVTGYIMSLVNQVDGRMGIVNGQSSSGHACLSTTATPITMDLTDISSVLTLTMPNLQCGAVFGSGSVATMAAGAGEAFGVSADGTAASVWTSLLTTTGGNINDFIDFANITNSGSTSASAPEKVDGMSIVYSSNDDEFTATRYKACSTLNTFEMYYASNTGYLQPISGGPVVLGAGFRIVSDGTHIYADGLLSREPGSMPNSGTLSSNNWYPFAVCLNGSDLSVDGTMSDCAAAYADFTLASNAALNYDQITGAGTAFDSIPLSGAVGSAAAPTTAITNEIAAKTPITAPSPTIGTF